MSVTNSYSVMVLKLDCGLSLMVRMYVSLRMVQLMVEDEVDFMVSNFLCVVVGSYVYMPKLSMGTQTKLHFL